MPKKPKKTDLSEDFSEAKALIEISGYLELGMSKEISLAVQGILDQKKISPDAFYEVITAVGVSETPEHWIAAIESAWQRQSAPFKKATNSAMLAIYGSTADWQKAAEFARPRLLETGPDFLFGIEALIETGRLKEARTAASKAEKALEEAEDEFEAACLIQALAMHHAFLGEWEAAYQLWTLAPRDQLFGGNAAVGRVELSIANALYSAREEIDLLSELPCDSENELILPGNAQGIRNETLAELKNLEKSLANLLPPHRWKQLGILEDK